MAPIRILLIKDSLTATAVFVDILHRLRYVVVECLNGPQAIDMCLAAQAPFDVIVMKVMRPAQGSLELIKRLKGHPATAHLPLICVLKKDSNEEQRLIMKAGCDACLRVPYRVDDVDGIIQAALGASGQPPRVETGR